jgi:N-acetylmuramoyl-L-alanine amidase
MCSAQAQPVIKANYGQNNTPRIGIQIGHYQIDQLPDDLASLRGQTGGSGGGVQEVDVNQDIARRVATLLLAKGAIVDILPATVPDGYTADAFVAIHADAVSQGNPRGYKLARSRFSAIPQTDDMLLTSIYNAYGAATGMPTDSSITRNMTGYYAFNSRNRLHAVSKITPAVIIETGFLTNAADRAELVNKPDDVAEGIATGIWNFITGRPALDQREQPINQVAAIQVNFEDTPVYAEGSTTIIAYVSKGQDFEYFDDKGSNYAVYVPLLRKRGYLRKIDVVSIYLPR